MNTDLYDILSVYDIALPLEITPIYKSKWETNANVWKINDDYILKKANNEEKDIEKTLMLNNFLRKEDVPVVEYIKTISGAYYTIFDDNIYSLMRKVNGEHIEYTNPFVGDYKNIAYNIGVETARLHKALKKLENSAVYESNLMSELKSAILEIKANNINIPCEIINSCLDFESDYNSLPKQVIHRDIQFGNMLFEHGKLIVFLDFDSSQVNARMFDIAYFGQSILFTNNYKDTKFVMQWIEFFNSFLFGYHFENILRENEIKAIYKLFLALQIIFISYYLYLEERRALIQNRVDMAKWIYFNEPIFTF